MKKTANRYLYRPIYLFYFKEIIDLMLQLKKPIAFIDLETTGTNLGSDRIVEIAIVKILSDGSRIVKRKLINPGIPIPTGASDIHGITDEMVKDAPTFKAVAHELKQVLDGCDLAGYNSNRFDVPLLMEEFLRAQVDFDMRNHKFTIIQKCKTVKILNKTMHINSCEALCGYRFL